MLDLSSSIGQQGLLSYVDWYVKGPFASMVDDVRLPETSPVRMFSTIQPAGAFPDPPSQDFAIQLVTLGHGSASVDLGAWKGPMDVRPRQMVIAPPFTACDYQIDGTLGLTILTIPHSVVMVALQKEQRTDPAHIDLTPILQPATGDPILISLMTRLWQEAANDHPMGALYAEEIAEAVAGRLVHLVLRGHGQHRASDPAPPLPTARLRRVLNLMDDGLANDLGLGSLAAAAGLSRWYFCRSFRSATGLAPHRYVLLRRIAKAQRLMRVMRLTLAEIAATTGFGGHAQLSEAFRRLVGTTPSEWRAAHDLGTAGQPERFAPAHPGQALSGRGSPPPPGWPRIA